MTDNPTPLRFLVVGMQRSGTTVAHQVIAGHPQVASNPREVGPQLFTDFARSYYNSGYDLFAQDGDRLSEGGTVERLFDLLVEQGQQIGDRPVIGLKVAVGQVQAAQEIATTIQQYMPALRVIHVARTDPIAAFASLRIAQKSGVFHTQGEGGQGVPKLTLSRHDLVRYINDWDGINRAFSSLSALPHYTHVNFEQDIQHGTYLNGKAIFECLGLDPMTPDWVSLRKGLPPVADIVVNLEEAEALFETLSPELEKGVDLRVLLCRYGSSLPQILAQMGRQALAHPATCLRRSYWSELMWKLRYR